MKCLFGVLLLFTSWKSFGQSIFPNVDTGAAKIAQDIVNYIEVKHRIAVGGRLWLNVDFRTKHVLSDGLSWTPVEQDSCFGTTELSNDSLFKFLLGESRKLNFIKRPDPGTINRIKIVDGLDMEDRDIYIEIMRPIYGWDILEILVLNYWQGKVRGGKAALKAYIYMPVIIFEKKSSKFVNYEFKYLIDYKRGDVEYKRVEAKEKSGLMD